MLTPVKRPRVSNEIVAQLQALIAEGKLAPGDQMPPERELAEMLKVSRNSVREAMRALEVLGVVEVRHGSGTFLTEVDMRSVLNPRLQALAEKKHYLLEALEVRRIIEPPASRLAADRATDADLERMRKVLEVQEESIAAGRHIVEEDVAFHRSIIEAAHNRVFEEILDSLTALLREFHHRWDTRALPTSVEPHKKLFDAIEAGDGNAAETLMKDHLTQIENLIRRQVAVVR